MTGRTVWWTSAATAAGLTAAFLHGGAHALVLAGILVVLEISISFDNAVVNASVLQRMSPRWQRAFLTVGLLVAVVGIRLVCPVLIVSATSGLSPSAVAGLAAEGGGADEPGTYAALLHEAHPSIAAFGGSFLLLLFLTHFSTTRELTWLGWLERPIARAGEVAHMPVAVACGALAATVWLLSPSGREVEVAVSGAVGILLHTVTTAVGNRFARSPNLNGGTGLATGKAAIALFAYLEVLDATFSFDGVVGAFAVTADPVVIAIGLGLGALQVRTLTVHLVRRRTLVEYPFLEHGAQWAIGSLAVVLLLSSGLDVPEVVSGLTGVSFIAAAAMSSIVHNRRTANTAVVTPHDNVPTQ